MRENVQIVPFEAERDFSAIQKILSDHPYLTYESEGQPAGTTEKYIKSSKYKTDVLQAESTTVGFVNYAALDGYSGGLLHLIGVDKEYQKRGFGKRLLSHAVKELEKLRLSSIFLMVKRDNIAARSLYEREGFVTRVADLSHLPQEMQASLAVLPMSYTKQLDIPTDELPQDNVFQ